MLNRIVEFSIRNKLVVAGLTLALVAAGLYALSRLPIDAVPDITNNQVQVVTISPGLPPEEVERLVTTPIELELQNLPHREAVRSVSRYGLSVVTVVFEEDFDVYIARQLVEEQLRKARENIPPELGTPGLMPLTTGLGEVFQYVLQVDSAYRNRYTPMDLRTIHDWVVKRQLSGIEGVAEISSFGGFMRRIEVALDPLRMQAQGVSVAEVAAALRTNNQNTGAGYLEQRGRAWYIRAQGLVGHPDELMDVVVRGGGGGNGLRPLLVRDVATVAEGYAPRYGALTFDGQGEAVGGITLMMKGENSYTVTERVHERVHQIQGSLPPGVHIYPYLERSALISRAVGTVSKNLIEGGLFVIFALVLLMGNLRAGFIVASVIPLSLLFAFVLMNLFGVSANLMSLGALDFGLVVDGAVIIVEGVLFRMHTLHRGRRFTQQGLDDEVQVASQKVSRSAFFGYLIILLVYLPLLALTGIEGRMFRPMALTVAFAILGALVLSVTYVPMLTALVLQRKVPTHHSFADRLVERLQRIYIPALKWTLRHKTTVVSLGVGLVLGAGVLFGTLGGEFVPSLEEGDGAIVFQMPTGTPLETMVRTTTRVEQLLLEAFPDEVRHVVSKIGTAEVPTDPMPTESADIMVVLHPKEQWTRAEDYDHLVTLMQAKLSSIPGAMMEFQQPIQLRFNELMTGAKADIAIAVYGDNLDSLFALANRAAGLIQDIPGAGDIKVEQIAGLRQLVVDYRHERLAQYGLNIEDLNTLVQTAMTGQDVGVLYDQERRFPIALRFDAPHRQTGQDLAALPIRLPSGQYIRLDEVAHIREQEGPSQISRDQTRRRVIVGVNVRGRDTESLVQDIQARLAFLRLPPGYNLHYGGEFENLQSASRRLALVVPAAMAVILVLLYGTFGSLRQALLVFAAVPMAAVGGVALLAVRGMPFSISAGVGFIALSGIAVLNGIVLVSYFNQLKAEGYARPHSRVLRGGVLRLRPVLTTALTAALGFIPMMLSTAPGSEVQRPLATVVVGGLISSTLLTLLVLPVLFSISTRSKKHTSGTGENQPETPEGPDFPPSPETPPAPLVPVVGLMAVLVLAGVLFAPAMAQTPPRTLSLNQALELGRTQHLGLQAQRLAVQQSQVLERTARALPPLQTIAQVGQINSVLTDVNVNVSQSIDWPGVYAARRAALQSQTAVQRAALAAAEVDWALQVRTAYIQVQYAQQALALLVAQDSLLAQGLRVLQVQERAGAISPLPTSATQAERAQIQALALAQQQDLTAATAQLHVLLGVTDSIIASDSLGVLPWPTGGQPGGGSPHPAIAVAQAQAQQAAQQVRLAQQQRLPGFSAGYFYQTLDLRPGFQGFQAGLSVPLNLGAGRAQTEAARTAQLEAQLRTQLATQTVESQRNALAQRIEQLQQTAAVLAQARTQHGLQLRHAAQVGLQTGDLDPVAHLAYLRQANALDQDYLRALLALHLAAAEFEYWNAAPATH